jgi:uncharacterized Zn-binding protein involved in type VI secretion
MPAVARKNSVDQVQSPHGTGVCCVSPTIHSTDQGSSDVFVNGIGVVREDDTMIPHTYPGPCCDIHVPPLKRFSSKVYVNGKRLARIGDVYILAGDHVIITGSSNVFDGSPQTG